MQHSVNDLISNQFVRSLVALKGMLMKATDFAKERKFDESLFLQLRMAPDMFPFVRQVQIATDSAKFAAARLSGKAAPAFPDEEKTMAELISRVEKTIEYLRGFTDEDFNDYTKKVVTFTYRPGVSMDGADYLVSHAIPNFYFHVTAAYALLRTHGVALGKQDFLGEQNWKKI